LTSWALRELDRRNALQSREQTCTSNLELSPRKRSFIDIPYRSTASLKNLKRFTRRGGPSLEDIQRAEPDLYWGPRPQQINRRVRQGLYHQIVPSTKDTYPVAPNLFLKVKAPMDRQRKRRCKHAMLEPLELGDAYSSRLRTGRADIR